jgi:hypothetical protein
LTTRFPHPQAAAAERKLFCQKIPPIPAAGDTFKWLPNYRRTNSASRVNFH